ncbi:MAG: hypothetical protein A3J38_10790 [Gammaproteobacteria bacterium RIFCSPHIGHO2_12_FULL_45_9]|nr:MAG: hypothetical protein A3J38_10790 [Gammaproteobacteria bacterium RIFCSPHIGHO2_12_FULL_45_9]
MQYRYQHFFRLQTGELIFTPHTMETGDRYLLLPKGSFYAFYLLPTDTPTNTHEVAIEVSINNIVPMPLEMIMATLAMTLLPDATDAIDPTASTALPLEELRYFHTTLTRHPSFFQYPDHLSLHIRRDTAAPIYINTATYEALTVSLNETRVLSAFDTDREPAALAALQVHMPGEATQYLVPQHLLLFSSLSRTPAHTAEPTARP